MATNRRMENLVELKGTRVQIGSFDIYGEGQNRVEYSTACTGLRERAFETAER